MLHLSRLNPPQKFMSPQPYPFFSGKFARRDLVGKKAKSHKITVCVSKLCKEFGLLVFVINPSF